MVSTGEYSLYIVRCNDGTLYTGIAIDVERRIREHESGVRGAKYLHILSPCAPGWRFDAAKTLDMGELAVKTGFHIMWKQVDGKFTLKKQSARLLEKGKRLPVEEYIKPQGRFAKLTKTQVKDLQDWVDQRWDRIARRAKAEC